MKFQEIIRFMKNISKVSMLFILGVAAGVKASETNNSFDAMSRESIIFPNVENPYLMELAVANESIVERKSALTIGLSSIIAKYNHNLESFSSKKVMEYPERYVKYFSYIRKNHADKSKLVLRVQFESSAIAKLLFSTSDIVWVRSRSSILLWLIDGKRGRKILSGDDQYELVKLLMNKSRNIGIDFILPIMDVNELKNVKTEDICEFRLDKIRANSKQYGVSSIVVGWVRKSVFGWSWYGTWKLLKGDEVESFSVRAPNQNELIDKFLNTLLTRLPRVLVPVSRSDNNEQVLVKVSGIVGLDQQNFLLNYLRNLDTDLISRVELVKVNSSDLEVVIQIVGGSNRLTEILREQDKLVPNFEIGGTQLSGTDLNYKWISN